jgi:hypothetical protein
MALVQAQRNMANITAPAASTTLTSDGPLIYEHISHRS